MSEFMIAFGILVLVMMISSGFNTSTPVAVPTDPSDLARRAKGVDTEHRAGTALRASAPSGWRAELQVMRERGGDFDAVIRGPARQHYVVEIKSHAGRPWLGEDGHFYLGRDERDRVLAQVKDQALESGAVPILWQPLASYPSVVIGGVQCVSGKRAELLWTLMTGETMQA